MLSILLCFFFVDQIISLRGIILKIFAYHFLYGRTNDEKSLFIGKMFIRIQLNKTNSIKFISGFRKALLSFQNNTLSRYRPKSKKTFSIYCIYTKFYCSQKYEFAVMRIEIHLSSKITVLILSIYCNFCKKPINFNLNKRQGKANSFFLYILSSLTCYFYCY